MGAVNDDKLLTAAELADMLNLSVGTVYQRRSDGINLPPAIVINQKHIRYRLSDVNTWLNAHTVRRGA